MNRTTETKRFGITKSIVWEAYKRIRANRGAAGIDGESIELFDKNLSKNLYKIWNRMTSGSYFPPSVRQVEIPTAFGTSSRDTEEIGRNPSFRSSHGFGSNRSDGSEDAFGAADRSEISHRLLWLSTGEIC
ncbi:hypothetical protein [Leptospira interrogans]|uniref:hypothetical protein n=1 Tax=Leptospira interrogans TaxID=173 RepID=UPI000774AE0A|nr:hypothetical protein [Leptospira interrogans]